MAYEYIENQCRSVLNKAIKYKKRSAFFNLLEWFTTYHKSETFTFSMQHIDSIYYRMKTEYWDKYFVMLSFGGCTGGTSVNIISKYNEEYEESVVKYEEQIKNEMIYIINNQKLNNDLKESMPCWEYNYVLIAINNNLLKHNLCLTLPCYGMCEICKYKQNYCKEYFMKCYYYIVTMMKNFMNIL